MDRRKNLVDVIIFNFFAIKFIFHLNYVIFACFQHGFTALETQNYFEEIVFYQDQIEVLNFFGNFIIK